MSEPFDHEAIAAEVRERYAGAARALLDRGPIPSAPAIVRAVKPVDWSPDGVRHVELPHPIAGLDVEADGCCGGTGCC